MTRDEVKERLKRYRRCKAKLETLRRREKEILSEMECPLCAVVQDGMPKGNSKGDGIAFSIAVRTEEIANEIARQIIDTQTALQETLDMISLLPKFSVQRDVLEDRYIDGQSYRDICENRFLSKTGVYRAINEGCECIASQIIER